MVTSMSQETLVLHNGPSSPALVDGFPPVQSGGEKNHRCNYFFFSLVQGAKGPKLDFFPPPLQKKISGKWNIWAFILRSS